MPTSPIPKHAATITHGALKLQNPDMFKMWLTNIYARRPKGTSEVAVEVVVKRPVKQRSDNENRYYWGVVIKMISQSTGAWPEDVHNEMRRLFLRIGGDKIPILQSSAELFTGDFEEYLSMVRMWAAAELGLVIPLPNECEI